MARVSGTSLGQTTTQFCALPQSTMPPTPISSAVRSSLVSGPVGWRFLRIACPTAAGPMNAEWSLYCGQASRQQPQVMQRESAYAYCCASSVMRGPGPTSYVPSIGTQARTRFRFSNMRLRSTARSRTTGNFENGSSLIG